LQLDMYILLKEWNWELWLIDVVVLLFQNGLIERSNSYSWWYIIFDSL